MKNLKRIIFIFLLCINNYVLDAQSLTQQQKTAIEKAIVEEMKVSKTPGAALTIINDNQVIYEKSFGFANSQTKVVMTDTTIFQIASVTKLFTALTLLLELKRAHISVNDPIGNVVKELSPQLSTVTFHQLLTHTSGMIDYGLVKSEYNTRVLEFLQQTGDTILFTKPGKVFSYSNTGYALIGLIIEHLTGKSYAEAVNDAVIKPLKLKNTTFDFLVVACRSFSVGHFYRKNKGMAMPTILHFEIPLYQAAGGLFSSIQDLGRLSLCLMNEGKLNGEQIFEREIIEQMSMRHAENYTVSASYYGYLSYPNNAYGYGLFMFDYGGLTFIGNGGAATQMTYMVYEPESKFAMIVTSNMARDFLISSFKKIFEVVLNEKEQTPDVYKVSEEELKEFTGKYIRPIVDKNRVRSIIISEKDSKMYIKFDNTGDIELEQISNTAFRYSTPSSRFPIEIGFYRDETGNIAYLRNVWRSWIKIE